VRITYGNLILDTPVLEDAGKFPVWSTLFEAFPLYGLKDDILFECWDRDKNRINLIGIASFRVDEVFGQRIIKKRCLSL